MLPVVVMIGVQGMRAVVMRAVERMSGGEDESGLDMSGGEEVVVMRMSGGDDSGGDERGGGHELW